MSAITTLPIVKRPRGRPRGSLNHASLPAMPSAMPPITVRTEEAARLLGVSASLMKQWLASGRVKSVKIGQLRLISVASLRQLAGE